RAKKLPKQKKTAEQSQLLKQIKSLEEHNRRLEIENKHLQEESKSISTDRDYYKKIIENAPSGFLILNSSGKVLYANRILRKITGTKNYVPGELDFRSFLTEPYQTLFAEKWDNFFKNPENRTVESRLLKDNKEGSFVNITGIRQKVSIPQFPDSDIILINIEDISSQKKTEQSLKESEARFKALHDASCGGIALHDNGKIIICNQGLSDMTGYSQDELMGMNALLLIPEDDRDFVINQIASATEEPYETNCVKKNGDIIKMRIRARNVKYNGKTVRATEFRDITDMKNARKNIDDTLEYLQMILRTTRDGFWIIERDGHLSEVNDAYCKMTGYNRDELLSLTISDLDALENPEDTAKRIERIMTQGADLFQTKHKRKDGTVFDIEVSSSFLSGRNKMICFGRDITNRKQTERELAELNQNFVTLLENTDDFVYYKGTDRRLHFCSQAMADITGFNSWKEMIGKHDMEIFPEDTAKIYIEEENDIYSKGIPVINKINPYYDRNKKRGWVQTSKWPVFDNDKKTVTGLFGISRDITEIKEIEQKLNRELEEKNMLLHEINHRIKNNIGSIEALLSIQASSNNSTETKAALSEAASRVKSMQSLYENMLISNKYDVVNANHYLGGIAKSVTEFYSDAVNITLITEIDKLNLKVNLAFPLGIIINELITNAAKYAFTETGSGTIFISLKKHKDTEQSNAEIILKDNGKGLPDDFLPDQAEGFGLMLVNMLCRQTGSRLSIYSQNGTVVKILVPLS
ncbi:MAG: PAS domain S-box protein, partial [Spirochaetes bacterium]|nr:PAS domain S-box protein [Spirochaetota bacterium]